MDEERLDVGGAVSYGWRTMVDNILFFVIIGLIFFIVTAIFYVPAGFAYKYPYITAIVYILGFLVSVYVHMAMVNISLIVSRGEKPTYSDLFSATKYYWKFLLADILYSLLVLAGMILCIIPGIYWGVRYHFNAYFIIDQDMSPIDAIRRSGQITKGAWWDVFLLFVLSWLIMLAGIILCGVGTLFAYPIVFMAIVFAYRQLQETASPVVTPAEAGPPAETPPIA